MSKSTLLNAVRDTIAAWLKLVFGTQPQPVPVPVRVDARRRRS